MTEGNFTTKAPPKNQRIPEDVRAKILHAVTLGVPRETIAREHNLTIMTVSRFVRNPAFQAQLKEIHDAAVSSAKAHLKVASEKAVQTLTECLDAPEPKDRIAAARAILDRMGIVPGRTETKFELSATLPLEDLKREVARRMGPTLLELVQAPPAVGTKSYQPRILPPSIPEDECNIIDADQEDDESSDFQDGA